MFHTGGAVDETPSRSPPRFLPEILAGMYSASITTSMDPSERQVSDSFPRLSCLHLHYQYQHFSRLAVYSILLVELAVVQRVAVVASDSHFLLLSANITRKNEKIEIIIFF